jgi:K+-transporting ATPase c subunit
MTNIAMFAWGDKIMLQRIRPAIDAPVAVCLIAGLITPLAATATVQVISPNGAEGRFIGCNGTIASSELVDQVYGSHKYFHGRPSATCRALDNPARLGERQPASSWSTPFQMAHPGGR